MDLNRRTLLGGTAAAAAATVLVPRAAEAATSTDWVVPMLTRATYGPTPYFVSLAKQASSQSAWLEQQLNPAALHDPEGDAVRALYPELTWGVTKARASIDQFAWDGMFALGAATIGLAAWSRRQLLEKMVELWSNHLNVTSPSDAVWDSRMSYDAFVIRPHALGRFSDMLVASATHPAMLNYLNQADSTKDAPNENYGRELLELHTVGIDAGYTEAMVQDSAKIMTGWSVDDNGLPYYDPNNHATGPVKVLGFSHPNSAADGRAVATAYLRYLASHPLTAQRIALKLATELMSDNPPAALVNTLAQYYLGSGTDIRPVIRRLFHSSEWKTGVKLKTPYQDLVSTVRVLGLRLAPPSVSTEDRRDAVQALYWQLQDLRQAPLAWSLPNGYPNVAQAFQAADVALGRWNVHQKLGAGWYPGRDVLPGPAARQLLPAVLPSTYGALVDALCDRLLFHRLDTASRNAVLTFCDATATRAVHSGDDWVTWRLPYLVALLLDTPTFASRA